MLIWSRAAPDELAIGHLERLAILNGISSRQKFNRTIERWRAERGGGEPSATGLLGLVTTFGENARDYVRHHAWLPNDQVLMRVKRFSSLRMRHAIRPSLRTFAPKHWKARFFCRECVLEDRVTYQFSYWHRIHQFPGVVHCERHSVGLSFVAHGDKPSLPHHHENHIHQIDSLLMDSVAGHPVVSRYYHVAQRLLEFEFRIPYPNAFQALSSRSRELGLFEIGEHWCEGLRRKALSELPGNWLKECFDGDLHRSAPPIGPDRIPLSDPDWVVIHLKEYALALAVLYESTDAALQFLTS